MKKMSYKELGFNEDMTELIQGVERALSFVEETEVNIDEWITKEVGVCEENDVLTGLSDREKYIYALGNLTGVLSERLM